VLVLAEVVALLGLLLCVVLLVVQAQRLARVRAAGRPVSPAELARLQAAALPPDLASLVQGPRVAAIARIRAVSGLGLADSSLVYELARAGKI
jgi:hypothetical protein